MTEHGDVTPEESRRDLKVATAVVLPLLLLFGAVSWTCFLAAFAGEDWRDWLLCSSPAWAIAGVLAIPLLKWARRVERGGG